MKWANLLELCGLKCARAYVVAVIHYPPYMEVVPPSYNGAPMKHLGETWLTWKMLIFQHWEWLSTLQSKDVRDAWVAWSVKRPTLLISAQVMISGSWAQALHQLHDGCGACLGFSLYPYCYSLAQPLSLPHRPPATCFFSFALFKKKYIYIYHNRKCVGPAILCMLYSVYTAKGKKPHLKSNWVLIST